MTPAWEIIVTRKVGSDRRVPVPERVLSTLTTDAEPNDARVFWSVAHDNEYLVVSDTPLQKPAYRLVTDTKLYTDDDGRRLRPPRTRSGQSPVCVLPGKRDGVPRLPGDDDRRGPEQVTQRRSQSTSSDETPTGR